MKEWCKRISPFMMFVGAVAAFFAAILLRERIPKQLSLALCTLGGVLIGFGVTAIALSTKGLTPEEQKEIERSETDERNVAIREKAAMSSWYWTLYMLWAAFMVIQIFVGGLWGVAISVVIVLHCAFYMINIHRWNKKM
ncbi:hypothetical protein D1646_12230 [Pseudoflavonifractor sp. 60]|uniref:hypothetical protein n=1 Tax=Pseudoflavonifractor sp. 60 TaxID=2304576 RepID=UPI00136A00BE|nr:hypothetical protein [Pseudoflavonifractor sp. 60]NBI67565.1 hypothetical protein [Pseudoflavonifractor sp. 60]